MNTNGKNNKHKSYGLYQIIFVFIESYLCSFVNNFLCHFCFYLKVGLRVVTYRAI